MSQSFEGAFEHVFVLEIKLNEELSIVIQDLHDCVRIIYFSPFCIFEFSVGNNHRFVFSTCLLNQNKPLLVPHYHVSLPIRSTSTLDHRLMELDGCSDSPLAACIFEFGSISSRQIHIAQLELRITNIFVSQTQEAVKSNQKLLCFSFLNKIRVRNKQVW